MSWLTHSGVYLLTKLLTVDHISGAVQGKSAGQRPTSYMRCTDVIQLSKKLCRHIVGILNRKKSDVKYPGYIRKTHTPTQHRHVYDAALL